MRGVGVIEFGGPEVLQVVDLPEVHAGAGEVRIRVHAATVNPTDTFIRNGARAEALRKDPPPYIPGMDIAGVIDEIGAGTTTDLAVGDAVMAMVAPSGTHGAYRESIVLSADAVAVAPARSTLIEAATLPMNGLTARQSLDQLGLQPGQTIAVTGAAGCYGGYVVQLAKADGLRVIADASSADEQLVRELGADIVVPRGDDIAAQIRKASMDSRMAQRRARWQWVRYATVAASRRCAAGAATGSAASCFIGHPSVTTTTDPISSERCVSKSRMAP